MDESLACAVWLSLSATPIGTGLIASQLRIFDDLKDPFSSLRGSQHLGAWSSRQPRIPWYCVIKPPPVGPAISANLSGGFCGRSLVCLNRMHLSYKVGQASWAVLLAVIHPTAHISCDKHMPFAIHSTYTTVDFGDSESINSDSLEEFSSDRWSTLPLRPLSKHKSAAVTKITYSTFITLICLTDSRLNSGYSDASGHRASWSSYCGTWLLEWRIGQPGFLQFHAHDSRTLSESPYPATAEQRVDKSLKMMGGIVEIGTSKGFKCGFPERQPPGKWALQLTPTGSDIARGDGKKHFYTIVGGKTSEVNFLRMKAVSLEARPSEGLVVLRLPNKNDGVCNVILYIALQESAVLNDALDNLPWTFLPWSIHQGLRDILVAFSKERMARYRSRLAKTLQIAVATLPERLEARGWNSKFVRENMADIATGALMTGHGTCRDTVLVVTNIAAILWDGAPSDLDQTSFWRYENPVAHSSTLDPTTVIALVKCFVLEWSVEFEDETHCDLPELYLG